MISEMFYPNEAQTKETTALLEAWSLLSEPTKRQVTRQAWGRDVIFSDITDNGLCIGDLSF